MRGCVTRLSKVGRSSTGADMTWISLLLTVRTAL